MNPKLHKLVLACPRCEQPPTIGDILFSADMHVVIDMFCPHCKVDLIYKTTMPQLVAMASEADLQEPEALELVKYDEEFLRQMHIKQIT